MKQKTGGPSITATPEIHPNWFSALADVGLGFVVIIASFPSVCLLSFLFLTTTVPLSWPKKLSKNSINFDAPQKINRIIKQLANSLMPVMADNIKDATITESQKGERQPASDSFFLIINAFGMQTVECKRDDWRHKPMRAALFKMLANGPRRPG